MRLLATQMERFSEKKGQRNGRPCVSEQNEVLFTLRKTQFPTSLQMVQVIRGLYLLLNNPLTFDIERSQCRKNVFD